MAGQSARYLAVCRHHLLTLLLLFLFRLMQCRNVNKFSVNELVGVRLPQRPSMGLRIDLVHRDSLLSPISPGNITSIERLKRALERSQDRLEKLQMSVVSKSEKMAHEVKDVQAPVSAGNGEFLMKLAIGKPSLSYSAILDTGSDLTWTQCMPCSDCYKQPSPIYDPSMSSSYSTVPCKNSMCLALPASACTSATCEYLYTYGDYSSTQGILSYETFTLSSQSVPHVAFGCGQDNEGSGFSQGGGLVGFGRGPLSFISQLGESVGNKFSYCLMSVTDSPSKTSALFLGETASLSGKTVGSTPIIQSSSQPTFYYLSLEAISVGGKLLNIPAGTFDLQPDGTGGLIIDSGTTITYLDEDFAAEFGLLSFIRFRTEVEYVGRDPNNENQWIVRSNAEKRDVTEEVYDAVVVCNGHYSEPKVAEIPGINKWPGKQIHCHNYRVPAPFQDQVVIVIGNGASGEDISRELASTAKEVHLSARSFTSEVIMKEYLAVSGNISLHPMIEYVCKDGTVRFRDGHSIVADTIIHCTGYSYHFPFLETGGIVSVNDNCVEPLYEHVFPPALAPSLSFVGLPWKVVPFPLCELQSRWIAKTLSGKAHLPSKNDMIEAVRNFYVQNEAAGRPKHYTHNIGHCQFEYDDWLADQCGCSHVEDWRRNIYRATSINRVSHPQTYRDEWEDHYWLEIALSDLPNNGY